MPNQQVITERITLGPDFPCHRLIDDHYPGRATTVLIGEESPTNERDFENSEVVWRNRQPTGTGPRSAISRQDDRPH